MYLLMESCSLSYLRNYLSEIVKIKKQREILTNFLQ